MKITRTAPAVTPWKNEGWPMKLELVVDNDSASLTLGPETEFEHHLVDAIASLNYSTVGTSRAYDNEGDPRGIKITFEPKDKKK